MGPPRMPFNLDNFVIYASRFAAAANPFNDLAMPTNRFYWLFILGALVLTGLVYLLRGRGRCLFD